MSRLLAVALANSVALAATATSTCEPRPHTRPQWPRNASVTPWPPKVATLTGPHARRALTACYFGILWHVPGPTHPPPPREARLGVDIPANGKTSNSEVACVRWRSVLIAFPPRPPAPRNLILGLWLRGPLWVPHAARLSTLQDV